MTDKMTENTTAKLQAEVETFNGRKALITSAAVVLLTWILSMTVMPDSVAGTAWCLVPALFLVVYVFATKRILEALTLAVIMALIMLHGTINVVADFSTVLGDVMVDPDMAWLIIVCGLMGGIVTLLERSGGAFAFGEKCYRRSGRDRRLPNHLFPCRQPGKS